MSDSITMANGAVLRVGDVVPMTPNGCKAVVRALWKDNLTALIIGGISHRFGLNGLRLCCRGEGSSIDLAALASPPAITLTAEQAREIAEALAGMLPVNIATGAWAKWQRLTEALRAAGLSFPAQCPKPTEI